ncbi:MAG: hypothetical protein LBU10_00835 [Endomicrobium sp.]|jgi:hypothetical protein|nr:hypothetical protein [Endomicrobium sp.]
MKKVLSTFTAMFFLVVNSYALEVNQKNNLVDFMKKDIFSFSSAYLKDLYTNKQLTNVNLELLRASDRLFSLIPKNNVFKIVTFCTLSFFNYNAGTTLHEIGHGLRLRSYGIDFMLMTDMDDSRPFTKDENYFNFFFKELFSSKRAACAANPIGYKNLQYYFESLGEINDFYNFGIVFSAGGINNNTYLSEQISNNIHFNNSSERPLQYYIYVNNLLYGALYDTSAKESGDDPFDIIYNFNQKVRNDFQKGTICDAGIKSLFLSATTYSYFYSFFTNKPMVKPYGFRLPDVFPYITTKGMSYKVVTGYEINESLNLIFGFESVFGKEATTEINIGLNHQTTINKFPISYKGIVTFGQGLDLEVSCLTPISKYFDVGLECEVYSVTSLMGQRHATTNMKDGQGQSKNLFAFIEYRY